MNKILLSRKLIFIGFLVFTIHLKSQENVYLKSWDIGSYPIYLKTPEKEGGTKIIRIVASNGSVGYVPVWISRGGLSGVDGKWESEGGLSNDVVEIMQKTNLLDHELLYDRMVEAGIPRHIRVAADIACWDLHARMVNKPFHALLGTKRDSIMRYGDVRGTQPGFSPEEYAQKVARYLKDENMLATKLHFPGAMGTAESISFADVLKTIRLVREAVGPEAILAYDPYPHSAESGTASLDEAKELLKELKKYNYAWVEGPLVPLPEDTRIQEYAELLKDAGVRVQPEGQGAIGDISSFETTRKWVMAGAADQFSTDAYFADGITPILRMIEWVKQRKADKFVVNLHWSWLPQLHIAMACESDIFPYFEFPMSHEVPLDFYTGKQYIHAPNWPGIYLLADSLSDKWNDVGSGLFKNIPEYEEHPDKLYNGVGNLTLIPVTGELYLTLNRQYGMYRSSDAGMSWQKVQEAKVAGRSYGGFSSNVDPQTGRFAVFMIKSTVEPQSSITFNKGLSWQAVNIPANIQHDGWTWGAVDWSSKNPSVIIGKQHHDMTAMWLSKDRGLTWEKLPFASRNPGVISSKIFVAAKGEDGKGIFRSMDGGKNWVQVSDFKVNGKVPVRWGKNFYWTSDQGVIVSKDKGKHWQLLGKELPGALWGPYFGPDENTLMVITDSGFYKTSDYGESWIKIAGLMNGIEYNVMHPTVSFGWDYKRNILYCAPVGGSVYSLQLK